MPSLWPLYQRKTQRREEEAYTSMHKVQESVTDSVIQATGRVDFEVGFRVQRPAPENAKMIAGINCR